MLGRGRGWAPSGHRSLVSKGFTSLTPHRRLGAPRVPWVASPYSVRLYPGCRAGDQGSAHEPPSRNRPARRRARGSRTRSGRRGRLRRAEPHPVRPAGASGPSAPRASWASRPRRWCAAPRTSCTTCTASPASCASGSWPRATSSTSWRTAGWCARRTMRRRSSEVSGRGRQSPGLALAPLFLVCKVGLRPIRVGHGGIPTSSARREALTKGREFERLPSRLER